MSLLQYYTYANIYILLFWLFYRVFLRRVSYFKSIRIYLTSAIILSVLLPLLQNWLTGIIESGGGILGTSNAILPGIGFIYNYTESVASVATNPLNLNTLFTGILISGGCVVSFFYLYSQLWIHSIVRKSNEHMVLENGLKVLMSGEVRIPFIYINKIVLPHGITSEEESLAIKHETMHHRYGHHFDNLLFSIFHIVFWLNPFFLLLKTAHKLNHEYQVDHEILFSGTDPIFYKLSLIKYSVGRSKFSLAIGLSERNIKNRLIMINNSYMKKGKWKFYLLIPVLGIALSILGVACIQPETQKDQSQIPAEELSEKQSPEDQIDAMRVEIITITHDEIRDLDRDKVIVVLINRSSQVLIAGEKTLLEDAEKKVFTEYNAKIQDGLSNIQVAVQKDQKTKENDFDWLLRAISMAQLNLQHSYAKQKYGTDFESLAQTEKEVIRKLIPFRIYYTIPDKNIGSHSLRTLH